MEPDRLLKVDAILELVKSRFNLISSAQWALLVAGTPDSETKAVLADTISDVIQRISSEVVRQLQPAISEHLRGQASQAQVSNAIDRCSPKLSECITETFAAALDLPPQKYEGAVELTTLVESEVKHRVTSAVSVARNTAEWPSDPTLFIRGTMSSVGNLASIFRKAVEYLRHVFARARTPCVVLCGRSAMKSGDMTDAVRGILLKWSRASKGEKPNELTTNESVDYDRISEHSDTIDVEKVTQQTDPGARESALLAALDITKSIIQEPFRGSGDRVESRLTRFNLNLKLISNKVKNFFKSQEKASPDGHVKLRRFRFFKFARMQFARMLGGLKRAFKNQDACLVSLRPDQPKSPKEAKGGAFRSSTLHVRPSQNPVFEFEAIQDRVAKMFDDLGQMEPEAREAKLKRYMDEKLRGFSQDLSSRLYEYLMSCQSEVYEVPSSRSDTPFMDSVLWGRRGKKHWDGGQKFSPEVLYAMTEDAAWRFLQQLLLWMETEPQGEETYADEVSGAVSEINQLVVTALNTDEDQDLPKTHRVSEKTLTKDEDEGTQKSLSVASESQPPQTRVSTQRSALTDVPGPLSNLSSVCNRTASFNVKLTRLLAYTLATQLGQRLPRKCKKSLKTDALMVVVEHLSCRAVEEISPQHIDNIDTMDNLEEVITPVVKKLMTHFGSPSKLVEAVMADEASFDDAVFKHLHTQLKTLREQPKASKGLGFFSSVAKLCSRST
ncbi:uncharacterized protein LOC133467185 [Phyllopteryx taeniolatus]|uniref:uncharacterized protein LOC133467185 n=1 Tax=Phyllopteryx taeniolatus TaxID=161469 RepID=UPI002AD49F8A|nr:uncharacterized protein LOC133467185 [Phyllopteryx taeniolatus]